MSSSRQSTKPRAAAAGLDARRFPRLAHRATVLALLIATSGCSATRALSNQYGNTLHYQAVDGPLELWFWIDADGTYQGWARGVPGHTATDAFAGTWHIDGTRNCRQQQRPAPPPGGGLYCEPLRRFPAQRTVLSSDGRFRVTLERGRQHPPG